VNVIEHRYGKLVYVERSEGDKKFSAHFWAQRPNGWRLLHVNDLEVRQRDYQTVPTTFNVPCTNPCQVLPYKPLGAGEKSALEAWQEQESGSAGWGKRVADNFDQRAVNTYGGRSASKKDRFAGMLRAQQQNPNRPQIGAAPVAFGRAWDFGESVLWVQLQPTYGDKPYWSKPRLRQRQRPVADDGELSHLHQGRAGDGAGPGIGDEEERHQLAMRTDVAWACCVLSIAASAAAQTASEDLGSEGDAGHHVLPLPRRRGEAGPHDQLRRRREDRDGDRHARLLRAARCLEGQDSRRVVRDVQGRRRQRPARSHADRPHLRHGCRGRRLAGNPAPRD